MSPEKLERNFLVSGTLNTSEVRRMAKRDRAITPRLEPSFAHLITPEHRSRLVEWISSGAPALGVGRSVPLRVRRMAREILQKSRGIVVSSTMALSTAIVALRGSGDFGHESLE